ncbi:MAG: hypothetical protein P8K08_08695 [Fuerstiella sp.]|nr:hypothetical protein [Fuerstiella sp.]
MSILPVRSIVILRLKEFLLRHAARPGAFRVKALNAPEGATDSETYGFATVIDCKKMQEGGKLNHHEYCPHHSNEQTELLLTEGEDGSYPQVIEYREIGENKRPGGAVW